LLLTATCSQIIAQKIMTSLNRFDFNIIRNSSLHRPEIVLGVIPKPSKLEKLFEKICESLDTITSDRIIIYSATVAHCNELATYLASRYGTSIIGKYHGSLDDITKNVNLNVWKNGFVRIMCATNAFGMGINVANIWLVIYTTFSMSLDNFVQEIGCAARDGEESKSILFFSRADIRNLLYILTGGRTK
ncbi:P-loop containing nucleoside triphosphate hydrolase protein, partial [Gigaspora rosea]